MEAVGKSCRGRSRTNNEDRYLAVPMGPFGVFAVADGMGGHAAGELASSLAIKVMEEFAAGINGSHAAFSPYSDTCQLRKLVKSLFDKANHNIWSKALAHPPYQGMGTTLTLALCVNEKVVLGNVGDSRCYLVKEDDIVLLTEDHSLVNHLLKKGEITPEQALAHPQKHVLTRALGTEKDLEVDIYTPQVKTTQYLLLCTDGLTSLVSSQEIYSAIWEEPHLDSAAELLVGLANDRGGHDNITLVIVKGAGV